MGNFFTRERFGEPQVLAGFLLLIFFGQCIWLLLASRRSEETEPSEQFRVEEGLRQWHGGAIAGTPAMERIEGGLSVPPEVEQNDGFDPNHSPLWYLVTSLPFLGQRPGPGNSMLLWNLWTRIPYVVFGSLLGASLWYVSRRLYGNAGGYIALALYCFSPLMIQTSTLWIPHPEIGAAWGTFGAIFTAIAVAHTLYAPREVVLWNWRRILLLGLSLALAIGSQFSLIVLVPLALILMLYVAPTRRLAALTIWATGCAVACLLIYCAYALRTQAFVQGVRHARFFPMTWRALVLPAAYLQVLSELERSGRALLVALPVALIAYLAWPRSRYFGNTAPVFIALLLLVMAVATPHYPGLGFLLMAVPFLFLFVAGVAADLLETPLRPVVAASIWGLLLANALWHLIELARVGRG